MEQDFDDTIIIRPVRGLEPPAVGLYEDTVLIAPGQRQHPPPLEPGSPAPPAAVALLPWYRFQVNGHEPISLDVPAYIGRNPRRPRVPQPRRPRLVRVLSPLQEVSGTHVELRQQGSSVIVTDLCSTNGTIVSLPGSPSRVLRQGESLVVTPGTVVDIGDGNRIEILPIQRLSLPGADPANGRLEL